ncbi:MAG: hypothetical protein KJ061_03740 [Vicinamibacteraceae bacterium]|nr:hypothetical protein [Vicinamibacteraceae bacterium]
MWFLAVAVVVAAAGVAAAVHFAEMGLTLSHYDAKAHLVVSRRIADSLTPGWRQIGAVWLPLPHLLHALPVQIDWFYRTGLFAVATNVAAFALASAALSWLVLDATRSRAAALLPAIVLAGSPDLLYLQSTSMTEPLLVGLLVAGVVLLYRWVREGGRGEVAVGLTLAGACWTRYEAWPVTFSALGLAWLVRLLEGDRPLRVTADVMRLALWPVAAILLFLALSRATVGEWFVTGGFYVHDNKAYRDVLEAGKQVWYGAKTVGGRWTAWSAVGGLLLALAGMWRGRLPRAAWVPLALVMTAVLPLYAFYEGHPFRIRYMVVLVVSAALWLGLGAGVLPRLLRVAAVTAIGVLSLVEAPPLWSKAPMVQEAQWDRPFAEGRRAVTACLAPQFRRPQQKVLASMGSLAHYMQELSHEGFVLSDFVHEGNGELWPLTLESPARHVDWILFEERAEGGDLLTQLRRRSPELVDGFDRVCEGGGVALYRRRGRVGSGLR